VKIWDHQSGEHLYTLEGHTEGISDLAWSNEGDYIASASDDKTIRIWSMETVCRLVGYTWRPSEADRKV
jgi:COMPASS component SWD3